MAEALISSVVKRLDSIIQDEWDLLAGVTGELEKLSTTMTAIRAVLQDAERKQVHDQAARDWLYKLKDAAHCIEDIMDKWTTYRSERSQVSRDGGHFQQQVLSNIFLPCFTLSDLALRHKTAFHIIKIRERLEQIAAEKYKYSSSEFQEVGSEEHQATYLLNETKIFGRVEDRDEIIKYLINGSGCEFATIAIVGPEGIGKTTLAGYIYNDVRVKTHFQKRMWVSLSSNFQVNRLAENIIAAAGKTYNAPSDPLRSLHDALRGKRFLLILDNVWNEHNVKWDQLKASLEGGSSGSRVVVTTRSQRTAVITSTDYPYTLSWLSDDACWSIFSSKAFHGRSDSDRSKLETIGNEIVKKCKGNPLAAEGVGNVMLFKRTEEEWLSVLQGEILDVPEITKAGILSYDNLPSHLKRCFAYFSLFPKGHTLSRDVLIKLWMAQNFIISRGGREEEDIGRDYFDELLGHSLFRDINRDSEGHVIQCIMHDLSHMLAQFVAKGECCTTEIERLDSGSFQGRHLSLIVNDNKIASPTPVRFSKPGNVRTLLVFSEAGVGVEQQLSHLINPLIHLRALDLSGTSIKWLPISIENLKLLRYLNLSGSCIEEVPKSVTRLRNLQTLNLNKCRRLQKLSKGISKMVSLRHLEIEETDKLLYLPKGIGELSSLRTLSKFMVDEMGKGCKIGELNTLNLLRGSLEMRNLGNVVSRDDAESAELKNKQYLRSLFLDFKRNAREEDGRMLENDELKKMESVLMGLGPTHANLKELNVCNYMGSVLPRWMEDAPFSSLVQLNLQSCRKFRQLPALGKLPSLKFLKIQGNEAVEVVGHEFYGDGDIAFPSLEKLSFISLTNWEEWKLGVEDGTVKTVMPSLQELCIQDCPKLEGLLGRLPDSLRRIEIRDCKQLIWTSRHPPLHLHHLWLRGDVGILTMPLPSLPSLKNLHISESPNQFSLHGIENLTALDTLEIDRCSELTSLTDRIVQLRALQTLRVYHCRKLTALPVGVGRLPSLIIYGCNQFTPLPDRVGLLKALQAKGVYYAGLVLTVPFCLFLILLFLRYME